MHTAILTVSSLQGLRDRGLKLLLNAEQGEKLLKGKPSDAAVAASVVSFKVAYELGSIQNSCLS